MLSVEFRESKIESLIELVVWQRAIELIKSLIKVAYEKEN